MKRLERIILVNWYLIDALEIPVEGHIAVIGPNASGKSSLLDAVQTVLLGGHGHYLSLNPSAGEKSKRSLRDYCLGVVRDPSNPDLSQDMQPRQSAISWLVLGFRDSETEQRTAVGLALQASLDQAKHQVDGRFIAPDCPVDLHDFVDIDALGERRPRPWQAVRDRLGARCPNFRHYPRPEAFVKALGADLSHDGSRHIEPTRFLRNFQNAITFAPIGNVSDFVRRYILDDKPIEIDQLRRSLQSYREIKQKIDEVSQRIDALKAIDKRYREADLAAARGSQYDWVAAELRLQALDAELEPLREEREELAGELAGIGRRQSTLEVEREALREQKTELEVRIKSSDHGQRKQRLDSQREATGLRLTQSQSALDAARRELGRLWQLGESEQLPEALREALKPCTALLGDGDELLGGPWPAAPESLQAALAELTPRLVDAQDELKRQYEQAVGELKQLEDELTALREKIRRLESGEADLGRNTRQLIERLAANGIRAQPLCDLIDVADEHWRATIESYLGGQREALIVAPDEAREAVRLYRAAARGGRLHGARLVNSTQTDRWLERCDRGSLAELIVTDDPHARAFCNRLMGRVQRVESEAELLQSERAATGDGMLHANGSVSRMKPEEPILGRASRAAQLEARREKFIARSGEFAALEQRKLAVDRLLGEQLAPLVDWLRRPLALVEHRAECERQQAAIADIERQLAELAASDDSRLEQQLAEVEEAERSKRMELDELRQREHERHTRAARLEAAEQHLQEQIERCGAARSAAASAPGMNMQAASELLAELEEKLADGDPAAALRQQAQEAEQRRDRQRRTAENRRADAYGKAVDYQVRHVPLADRPLRPDEHPRTAALVAERLRQLEDTELADYGERASAALREAELTFRADFVGRLQENLAQLQEKIAEINRHLRSRPFHGEVYSFTRSPAPDYAGLIDWVEAWRPEAGQDVGGLFDDSAAADNPHRKAIAQVQNMLMEAAESGASVDTALADYRNYYVYDVKMSEVDGDGERNTTFLSKRLGRGSGGEHQSPFYVAIGAALAATYRIVKKPDGRLEGGMALAVFDEAFSKLDVANTQSALAFLDELGLQVLLAAPDEKYGLMSEHMDTVVNVYRSGGAIHIDCEHIKPAAHQLLGADNPLRAQSGGG